MYWNFGSIPLFVSWQDVTNQELQDQELTALLEGTQPIISDLPSPTVVETPSPPPPPPPQHK